MKSTLTKASRANPGEQHTDESRTHRYCTFRLSGRLFGVDIRDVKEINTEINITPIFHAPREIKGYINIRGQIYLLFDLRAIFSLPEKDLDKDSRVVLFMPEIGNLCGILVDSIEDVISVGEDLIENRRRQEREAPDGIERRNADIGEGVCKLRDELLIILNAERLVRSIGSAGKFQYKA
ncbi:MAG: chemotaxis protein CheW [Desulfobulbaceae bacterium]|jgi:purine-binding chemotaxis protein CheW|nr:chemotaxis protein CheW [Desulfobulbaceae bacterium]MDY0350580.1 chemotaxis protein CheW [Desulfobulbaceae bacterium]